MTNQFDKQKFRRVINMFNIDEAIAHERDVAKEIYFEAMLCHANPDDEELDGCIKCSKYHEQLAEWLEELREKPKSIPIANITINKDILQELVDKKVKEIELDIQAIMNKAIDDFASKLIMYFADQKLLNAPYNDDETDRTREIICETIENAISGVEEIAEQLKAGGSDE